jgi:hypothetical protein
MWIIITTIALSGSSNRDDFIYPKSEIYELTTINIHPDDPEDAIAQTCPNLITGFF